MHVHDLTLLFDQVTMYVWEVLLLFDLLVLVFQLPLHLFLIHEVLIILADLFFHAFLDCFLLLFLFLNRVLYTLNIVILEINLPLSLLSLPHLLIFELLLVKCIQVAGIRLYVHTFAEMWQTHLLGDE